MQSVRELPGRIEVPARAATRRATLASYVGSTIEYYDFFIYGTAAALVFPMVFFPHLGTTMATVASLGSFASAFLARPVGAAFFGHMGDRIGRKRTLVITLVMMGLATVGVGLIPATATIGMAAPALLIALRLIQGFAVGGEWAGAALLCAESAPREKRSYACMFTQLGLGTALVLANLVFLLAHTLLGTASTAFLEWGWRIPFLLSAVLLGTALYVRLKVDETPAFAGAPQRPVEVPILQLLRRQAVELLLAVGVMSGLFMLAFQAGTYFTTLAQRQAGISRTDIFVVGVLGGLATVATVFLSAASSRRHGTRRTIASGFALAVPWSFVVIPMIETGEPLLYGLAIVVTYAITGIVMGPLGSFIPGIFAFDYRYTGAAMTSNLAGIVGGAIPPVLSPALMAAHGSGSIAVMMAGFSLVSLLSVMLLRRHDQDATRSG